MDLKNTETMLVGILLHKPDLLVDVSGIVDEKDFVNSNAARSYSVILDLWSSGSFVDLAVVAGKEPDLITYLSDAIDVIPTTAAAIQYATEISKSAISRRVALGLKIISERHKKNPEFTLDDLITLVNDETKLSSKDNDIKSVLDRFDGKIQDNKDRGMVGLQTGFDFLEDMRIQYVPGQIVTIGGFTSVGKTAVMVEMICRIFNKNPQATVAIVSTEMTELQIVARLIANRTGFHTNLILSGTATGYGASAINEKIEQLKGLSFYIYDDIYKLTDIEMAARKLKMQGGIDILFVDYVQNCQVPDAKSEYQEQATLAKRLQKLAKDTESTVVCLSQVSNSVGRGGIEQLELKGAGEWAAVSDVSIMLMRNKKETDKLLFTVKKNRHGMIHGFDEGYLLKYENNFTSLSEFGVYESK